MDQPLQQPLRRALQPLSVETISSGMNKIFFTLKIEEQLDPYFNYLVSLFTLLESAQEEYKKLNLLEIIYTNISRFNEALFSTPRTQNRVCKDLSENPKKLNFSIVSSVLHSISHIKVPDTFRMEKKEHTTFKFFCSQIYHALLFSKIPDDPIVTYHSHMQISGTSGSSSHVFDQLNQTEWALKDSTPETLYAYLRFALIGSSPHRFQSFDSKQTPVWFSTIQPQTKICEFLSVILNGLPPEILVYALKGIKIGGQSEDICTFLPPLLPYFLHFEEPAKLIIGRIQKHPELLQQVTDFIFSNFGHDVAKILLEKIIQCVISIGTEPLILKQLFARSVSHQQKYLNSSVYIPLDKEYQTLPAATKSQFKKLDGKLINDISIERVEFHWHKKRILFAVLESLNGETVDFRSIEEQNPRYAEGFFSNETVNIVQKTKEYFASSNPKLNQMNTSLEREAAKKTSERMNTFFFNWQTRSKLDLLSYFETLNSLFKQLESAQIDSTKPILRDAINYSICQFNLELFSEESLYHHICTNFINNFDITFINSLLCFIHRINSHGKINHYLMNIDSKELNTFRTICTEIHSTLFLTKILGDPIVNYCNSTPLDGRTPGSIEIVLNQFLQIEKAPRDSGYPRTKYEMALTILNFVEANLTDDFTPETLKFILNSPYQCIQTCPETLYAYLRFALIGPKRHRSQSFDSKQTPVWFSAIQPQTKICEFLSVILNGLPPEILVNALKGIKIGGQSEDICTFLPPLLPYFLHFEEPAKLIIGRIQKHHELIHQLTACLFGHKDPHNPTEILLEKMIQCVTNLASEPIILKTLFEKSLPSRQRHLETALNEGTLFPYKQEPRLAFSESSEIESLYKEIMKALRVLNVKLTEDNSTERVALHWHKKRVLLAALGELREQPVDLRLAKEKNPHYKEASGISDTVLLIDWTTTYLLKSKNASAPKLN